MLGIFPGRERRYPVVVEYRRSGIRPYLAVTDALLVYQVAPVP